MIKGNTKQDISSRQKAAAISTGAKGLDFSEQAEFEAGYVLRNVDIGPLRVKRNGFIHGARADLYKSRPIAERKNPVAPKSYTGATDAEQDVCNRTRRGIAMGEDPFGDND